MTQEQLNMQPSSWLYTQFSATHDPKDMYRAK